MKHLSPLRKQLIKFTIIGMLAVLVDLAFYYFLLNILPEKLFAALNNEVLAKAISFVCGIVVTYNLNKFWTWKKRDRSHKRFIKFMFLYGGSMVINVGFNSLFLYVLKSYTGFYNLPNKYFIAFVGATGMSALINFIGQKFWVFTAVEPKLERI